ncbi:MAG: IS30 family transposase [Anaerolineales bacterium]|nr:IS30 family transposase [Anaerolineales bacterium]
MGKYTQLTPDQRSQIYALKKVLESQQAIADVIGVHQATISRELRRNKGKKGYRNKQAQKMRNKRRLLAATAYKMTPMLISTIKSKLKKKWSPDQISGWLLRAKSIRISHESIYQYIWKNKRLGGNLFTYLRRQGKAYQSRGSSQAGRGHIKNRVSISERPSIVDEKQRIGDWEIDLVIGKSHSGALVTIVDRATSFSVSKRIDSKAADIVTAATISLLTPYKEAVHTITADNGKEFAYHEQVTAALGAPVYFADPYSSWQRGLNENTNGLLRQWWPKGTDFKTISQQEVVHALADLNDRPRKKLNYKTPADLMAENMAALAA